MSDLPDDPFSGLPEELRQLLEQLGGPAIFQQMQGLFSGAAGGGPVNWDLARQVALQLAADGDRSPTPEETERAEEAARLADHWLDEGNLPSAPDGGQLLVGTRQDWVAAALTGLKPYIEPVAAASTRAMSELWADQAGEMGLPEPIRQLLGGIDLSQMLAPMGATLAGMQTGQVIGQLAGQLFGQYDLGIPTASPSMAFHIAPNVSATFEGYDLDPMEVAIALALHEAAHRRQFHAIPWLTGHIRDLVAKFAEGAHIDPQQLMDMSQELMTGIDPDDPEQLQAAMEKAANFRMEPTTEQRQVLRRLQAVTCLTQAWARSEVARAAGSRLPNLGRIEEVLRRRRATQGDGERLLEQLLGLDLKPEDETVGDRFVATVEDRMGEAGLRRALAHPENLPDTDELADPFAWLERMEALDAVPDDPSALFGAGDAPTELSADERLAAAGDQKSVGSDEAAGSSDAEGDGDADGDGDGGDAAGTDD